MSGTAGIPDATAASGGGVKGKITVDSDYGLDVASGVLSIDLATNPGLEFSSGDLTAKVDTNAGLELSASGIGVDLAATWRANRVDPTVSRSETARDLRRRHQ